MGTVSHQEFLPCTEQVVPVCNICVSLIKMIRVEDKSDQFISCIKEYFFITFFEFSSACFFSHEVLSLNFC
jgi:hypothetical protein